MDSSDGGAAPGNADKASGRDTQELRKHLERCFWVIALVLALVLTVVGTYRACRGSSDFRGFYISAQSLLATGEYPDDQPRYFPTFQLLLLPLAALPLPVAAAIWNALNLGSLAALPAVVRRLTGVPPSGQILPWLVVAPFFWANFVLSQNGSLLLLLAVGGLLLAIKRRGHLGGALIALAAGLKVLPAAFLALPMVLRRARRPLVGFAVVAAALFAGMVLVTDYTEAVDRVFVWVEYVRGEGGAWGMIESGRSLRYNNQGLAVTLVRTLSTLPADDWAEGSLRLDLMSQQAAFATHWVILAAVAAGWAVAAWSARRMPTARAWSGMFAVTSLVILMLSPLVWTHYFIWWLGPLMFLSRRPKVLVVIGVLSAAALTSVHARALGVHMWLSLALYALVLHDHCRYGKAPADAAWQRRQTDAAPAQ